MTNSPNDKQKIRIDQLLYDQGLAPSRQRAQALVLAGKVLVGDTRVEKSSERFPKNSIIRLKGKDHPYVSRGGVKLAGALEHFHISAQGKTCLDVGASTGGFTDCLLQKGARKIYTLDSGTNQLAFSLRQDPRVHCRENFNARYLTAQDLPEAIDLVVVDVAFISLRLLLPPLQNALKRPWQGLFLIKPQFEAGKGQVGKGGVIRDHAMQHKIVEEMVLFFEDSGMTCHGWIPATLKGEQGNQEYFLYGSFQ